MAIQPISIESIKGVDAGPMTGPGVGAGSGDDGGGFGSILAGLGGVEQGGNTALTDLAVNADRDLHDVVLAVEMESISFDLAVQVRNRMVEAYQEIFRMNV